MSVQVREPQSRPYPSPSDQEGNGPPAQGSATAHDASPGGAVASPPGAPGVAPQETSTEGVVAAHGAADTIDPADAPRSRPAILTRRVLLPLFAVILIAAAIFGFNTYRESQLYVSTDNAQLTAQPVQVGAMNAGRVEAILPNIGDRVQKGDVIAQVALPSQIGTGQNGQPKLGFLSVGDTQVDVQAPLDGIVIAEPVAVGTSVTAGQAIVTIVDPTQLWVNANIEETNIARVKLAQHVTVHVDSLNADVPGKVDVITPATAATSSVMPASNTSGNFTKTTQLVPVRVSVNLGNQPMLLGANVEVKIRVAD